MSQEHCRRRACPIGARTKDRDQITHLGAGQFGHVGEPVQRRAKATDHVCDLTGLFSKTRRNRHRIIAPHHGPEITGRRQLVMKAAIGDQVSLIVANLLINYPAQVNARFANEIAPQFKAQLGIAKGCIMLFYKAMQGSATADRSSGSSPGK